VAGANVGKLSIKIMPDTTKFKVELKAKIKEIEKSMVLRLKVEADTSQAELDIARFRTIATAKKVDIKATVTTAAAKAQIAVLARPRFVTFIAKLDGKAVTLVEAALARLSGFRVARSILTDVTNAIKDIDLSVPKISRVALGIASLTSLLVTASAGLVTTTGDLLKMGNAAFILPAMLAGAVVGIGTLWAALKDTKTELGELAPAMHALQDSISEKFWSKAREPILDFVYSILPQARAGFDLTATALGNQAAALSDAFKSTFADGVLLGMFEKLAETMDIITTGAQGFAEAVTTLGVKGSEYLPRFAQWIVDIGTQFNNWLQAVSASGELDAFIEDGITQMKLFGSSIADIVRIFKGIDSAATDAGAGGLATFAANMKGAQEKINSPEFQTALSTIIRGSMGAMDGIGAGISSFGSMLAALAPEIESALTTAGEAVGGLLTAMSEALDQPAFKKGLGDFFDGIKGGVDALGPAMEALFGFVGRLGTAIGEMAKVVGPVLAAMKTTFAPLLDGILDALTPLIPMIGGVLVGAIEKVGPLFQALGGFVSDNAEAFRVVALTVVGLALAIKGVSFAVMIAGWIANTAAMVKDVAQTLILKAMYGVDMVKAFAKMVAKMAIAAAAWAVNTAAVAKSIAETLILKAMYGVDMVKAFAKMVAQMAIATAAWIVNTAAVVANKVQTGLAMAGTFIAAMAGRVAAVALSTGAMVLNTAAMIGSRVAMVAGAVAMGIATAAQWAFNVAMNANPIALIIIAVLALVAAIVWFFTQTEIGQAIWTNFTTFLTEAWTNIQNVATTVFTALGQFFSDTWNNIVTFVTTAIDAVLAVIIAVGATISSIWSAIWDGIGAAASFVWSLIVSAVTGYIALVLAVIQAVGSTISSIWSAIWNGIGAAASFVWDSIVAAVKWYINLVLGVITAIGSTIASIWSGIWDGVTTTVSNAWTGITGFVDKIVSGVSNLIGTIKDTLAGIPETVKDAFSNAGKFLFDAGKSIVQGLIDGVNDMIGKAKEVAENVMSAISDFFPHSPAKEGPFSGRGWTLYSGQALGDGMIEGMNSRVTKVRSSALAMMGAAAVGTESVSSDAELVAARLAGGSGGGDTITIGNVGYDPAELIREINLRKRQAAMTNGLSRVAVA